MKKQILATAAIIGLVAAPSIALAHNGSDDTSTKTTGDVSQEDRLTEVDDRNGNLTPTPTLPGTTPSVTNSINDSDDNPATHEQNENEDNDVDDEDHGQNRGPGNTGDQQEDNSGPSDTDDHSGR
jgi:hypothetical protein